MALTRGAIAKRPKILESRPLTREDLACLREKRPGPPAVQQLRDTHHRVARLVASGLRLDEVVERSGYSYQRVTTLTKDPAFQELVAKYRSVVDAAFERQQDHYMQIVTGNMLKAEVMISDKLDDAIESGETLPTRDLLAISRDAADRFGYGKKSFVTHDNLGSQLEKAMARSGKAVTIDAKAGPASRAEASEASAELTAPGAPHSPSTLKALALRRSS